MCVLVHFENLNIVFFNACRHLKAGGTFEIVNSKTRNGLKHHRKSMDYNLGRNDIPNDDSLHELLEKYEFKDCIVMDEIFSILVAKKATTPNKIQGYNYLPNNY